MIQFALCLRVVLILKCYANILFKFSSYGSSSLSGNGIDKLFISFTCSHPHVLDRKDVL